MNPTQNHPKTAPRNKERNLQYNLTKFKEYHKNIKYTHSAHKHHCITHVNTAHTKQTNKKKTQSK